MAIAFKRLRGDIILRAAFTEPAFSLMGDLPEIYRVFFSALSQYELQLADMKVEQGTGSLGDVQLGCFLMNFGAAVRLRLDRVEVQSFDILRVTQKQVHEISDSFLSTLTQHAPGMSFQPYSLAVAYHGILNGGTTAREFLSRLTAPAPQELGPILGSGAVFYYGAQGDRVSSSLVVDLSGALKDTLYVKAEAVWDSTKLSIHEVGKAGLEYVYAAHASIGLEIREE